MTVLPRVPPPVLPRRYQRDTIRHWTDTQWATIPVVTLPIHLVVPTQEAVALADIARLTTNGHDLDTRPTRIVYDQDTYWLHDGHHRWLIKTLRGDQYINAYIVDHNGQPINPRRWTHTTPVDPDRWSGDG